MTMYDQPMMDNIALNVKTVKPMMDRPPMTGARHVRPRRKTGQFQGKTRVSMPMHKVLRAPK